MSPGLLLLGLYALSSLVALLAYALDKSRARRGGWRIPEKTLHLIEACGGWPGAFLAQRLFHHKSRKGSYQLVFWIIVAAHLGLWCLGLELDLISF